MLFDCVCVRPCRDSDAPNQVFFETNFFLSIVGFADDKANQPSPPAPRRTHPVLAGTGLRSEGHSKAGRLSNSVQTACGACWCVYCYTTALSARAFRFCRPRWILQGNTPPSLLILQGNALPPFECLKALPSRFVSADQGEGRGGPQWLRRDQVREEAGASSASLLALQGNALPPF